MSRYGLDHITINVINLKESKEFYQKILKLQFLETIMLDDQSITYFQINEETRLELIDYFDSQSQVAHEQKCRGTYRHFALRTNALSEIYQRCIEYEVPIRMEPTDMPKLGCRGFLFVDPNGVEVEIVDEIEKM